MASRRKKATKRRSSSKRRAPGPPPEKLVNLLKSDPDVLEYFRELQSSLEADVQVWKDRAARYKEENEALLEERRDYFPKEKRKKNRGASKKTVRSKTSKVEPEKNKEADDRLTNALQDSMLELSSSDDNKQEDKAPKRETGKKIEDSMFDFGSSSDEEDKETKTAKQPSGSMFELASSSSDDGVGKKEERERSREVPIGDSMFDLDSSSDDGDSESGRPRTIQNSAVRSVDVFSDEGKSVGMSPERLQIFRLLQEAYLNFGKLGVRLVMPVGRPAEESQEQEDEKDSGEPLVLNSDGVTQVAHQTAPNTHGYSSDNDESRKSEQVIFHRRSDEEVAADILHTIRDSTRIHTRNPALLQTCPPFDQSTLLPCCNVEMHPAAQVKSLIFRTLILVDTFCSPFMSDAQWEAYFTGTEDLPLGDIDGQDSVVERMKVGLRNRKTLVDDLIQSLTGEMIDSWPVTDRSTRHNTSSLHFECSEVKHGSQETQSTSPLSYGPKSVTRLTALAERCLYCQIVVALYLSRNDLENASQVVCDYALSSVPSLGSEDYPRMPPVMSLLCLESMVSPDLKLPLTIETDSIEMWFQIDNSESSGENSTKPLGFLRKSLAVAIFGTAAIWKERTASPDDRIRGIACVEYQCFLRLRRTHSSWLEWLPSHESDEAYSSAKTFLGEEIKEWVSENLLNDHDESHFSCVQRSMETVLVLNGDTPFLLKTASDLVQRLRVESNPSLHFQFGIISKALKEVKIRQLDAVVDTIGGRAVLEIDPGSSDASDYIESSIAATEKHQLSTRLQTLRIALETASSLSDGTSVFRIVQSALDDKSTDDVPKWNDCDIANFLSSFQLIADMPVARVINLQRRRDRMVAFETQALCAKLLILKGVARFSEEAPDDENLLFGGYAIDGRGRMKEAEDRLCSLVGSHAALNKCVAVQWRPHDLKPFDRNAPNHENLVMSSPSERACALSHMCTWLGVARSLKLDTTKASFTDRSGLFRHASHMKRLVQISGFATGQALLPANQNLPPAPVCLIFEDDALLVDRFTDRLGALLKELPRDFHFCALGYSRPKTAPIVPFSPLIGIPTMQWYLTGYLLSEQGAQHLLDSRPIVGPVDSWVGLKMTANWDNVYGAQMGVGANAKLHGSVARRDVCRILQFRAFCALQPLCSQRVASPRGSGTGRSWRHRDTDIEYSGDKAPSRSSSIRNR